MVTVLWIVGVALCCGLCVYGITTAVRRSKARREARALQR
jgi:hypothetical protein